MAKAIVDEDHMFMYHLVECLLAKAKIDYAALAQAVNLSEPAARMRWILLKARIEEAAKKSNSDSEATDDSLFVDRKEIGFKAHRGKPENSDTESDVSGPPAKKRYTLKRKRDSDDNYAEDNAAGAVDTVDTVDTVGTLGAAGTVDTLDTSGAAGATVAE